VFEAVCQAVGYAHAHGVIHRDLKPANVMVGAFGEVQVMDWGLAKVLASRERERPEGDPDATLGTEIHSLRDVDSETQAGSLLGTPAYMPPEQAMGAIDEIDARSDVFGLGAILCAVLTGRPPYVGANAEDTRKLAIRGKLDDTFARLAGCGADPDLVALCRRCLSAEKADRPADAGAVAKAVADLRAAADERARQAEVDRVRAEAEAREQRKRRRAQLALAAAVGLLLAGGGAFAWWDDKQATARRTEAENRDRDERERATRNARVIESLLDRCADALRTDDATAAGLALDQAVMRAAEGGAEDLRGRLERCRTDLALLHVLNEIDTFRWAQSGNVLPKEKEVATRWQTALADYGLGPGAAPADQAAGRVNSSLVRDRLMGALDQWLGFEPRAELLAVLRSADPDPYRNDVRGALAARDTRGVVARAMQPEALVQPAWFAAVLGSLNSVPVVRRRLVLKTALYARPGDLGLLMTLGRLHPLKDKEEKEERIRWLHAAVAAHPGNSGAHFWLGIALWENGDLDGAVPELRAAYRLNPTSLDTRENLVVALRRKRDWEDALAVHQEALRQNPDSESYHFACIGVGETLEAKGDVDEAIAFYRNLVRTEPNRAFVRVALSSALRHKGELDSAIAELRESIRLNPNYSLAHNNLAWVLSIGPDGMRDGRRAVDHATRACELSDWKDPRYIDTLAAAHAEAGDFDKAIEYQKKALSFPAYKLPYRNEGRQRLDLYTRKVPYRDPALARREVAPPPRAAK
jgi:tetratricopeptide (TPR) repeat protein